MVWASTLLDAERRQDWIVARTIGEDDIVNGIGVACIDKSQCYDSGVDVQEIFNGSNEACPLTSPSSGYSNEVRQK